MSLGITAEDGVMGFEILKNKVTAVQFAKWLIWGSSLLDEERYVEIWQREMIISPDGLGVKFLVADDAALAELKVICAAEGVELGKEIGVELSAAHKQYIIDSNIYSINHVDDTVARAERIDAATTVDELKVEMLKPLAQDTLYR